jgi:hypothetical protein
MPIKRLAILWRISFNTLLDLNEFSAKVKLKVNVKLKESQKEVEKVIQMKEIV